MAFGHEDVPGSRQKRAEGVSPIRCSGPAHHDVPGRHEPGSWARDDAEPGTFGGHLPTTKHNVRSRTVGRGRTDAFERPWRLISGRGTVTACKRALVPRSCRRRGATRSTVGGCSTRRSGSGGRCALPACTSTSEPRSTTPGPCRSSTSASASRCGRPGRRSSSGDATIARRTTPCSIAGGASGPAARATSRHRRCSARRRETKATRRAARPSPRPATSGPTRAPTNGRADPLGR